MTATYETRLEGWGVSRETFLLLDRYVRLVEQWGKAINVVADPSYALLWERHVIDSVQLMPSLRALPWNVLVDLGSGGGFPGIVIAACFPDRRVVLVDSDKRKCTLLKIAVSQLGLQHVEIRPERIESVKGIQADVITARACASLEKLIETSAHLRHNQTHCLFMKGLNAQQEVDQAQAFFAFDYQLLPSATQEGAATVAIPAASIAQRINAPKTAGI